MQSDKYSYRYTRFFSNEVPKRLKEIDYSGKVVLDLGAGDGEIIYGLERLDLLKSAKKVYCVEISAERCKLMKQVLKPMLFDHKVYKADATDLKHIFPDNCIDIIICNQVIEHVEDDKKLVQEIYRLLKAHGVAYVSTVYKKPVNFCYHRNAKGERVLDPTHVREYTDDALLAEFIPYFCPIYSSRMLQWFSVTDFIFGRLKNKEFIYEESRLFKKLRKIKLPIVGCYNWEFYLEKYPTHANAVSGKIA